MQHMKPPNVLPGQGRRQQQLQPRVLSADLKCSFEHESLRYPGTLLLNKTNICHFLIFLPGLSTVFYH